MKNIFDPLFYLLSLSHVHDTLVTLVSFYLGIILVLKVNVKNLSAQMTCVCFVNFGNTIYDSFELSKFLLTNNVLKYVLWRF